MKMRILELVMALTILEVRVLAGKAGRLNIDVYSEQSPMASLGLVVVREILQRLQETRALERSSLDTSTIEITALARDSVKLSLMAYMGFQGEDECLQRTACETGELVRSLTASAAFFFTAMDYFAPIHLRRYISVARDAAEGHSCTYYRCGARPYEIDGKK